jgi:hypothetical protein
VADAPLTCRLDALDPRERARHASLVRELSGSIAGIAELPDGYVVRFPSRPFLFLRLAEWIELERACCPFLRIGLELARASGEFRVSLTGPPGAKELLAAELPSFTANAPPVAPPNPAEASPPA